MSTVLALEAGSSKGDDKDNTGHALMDSLSYVDSLTDAEKKKAEELIDEEVKRSQRHAGHYMSQMEPMPKLFPNNPCLREEYQRVAKGDAMTPLDLHRFELPEPKLQDREKCKAWKSSLDNAAAQLEHQQLRLANLELMRQHGSNVWRAHNQQVAASQAQIEQLSKNLGEEVTRINQRRKLMQMAAASDLDLQNAVYNGLAKKTIEIEVACQLLEQKIEQAGSKRRKRE